MGVRVHGDHGERADSDSRITVTGDWDGGDDDAEASGPRLGLTPLPGGAQLTLSAPWF